MSGSTASPRLITEVDQDTMTKINDVCDFVNKMRTQIESQYRRWYTLKEAADYMNVSTKTLSVSWREKIKPKVINRMLIYDRHVLDRFLEEQN